jgi:hypothetical protein
MSPSPISFPFQVTFITDHHNDFPYFIFLTAFSPFSDNRVHLGHHDVPLLQFGSEYGAPQLSHHEVSRL